jgi:GTPase SAR1 family protein
MFLDKTGPSPIWVHPKATQEKDVMSVAIKSISLLAGERIYQFSFEYEIIKYFGIIPFPDLSMVGITYFFLIPDENSRGKAKATTITALVDEKNSGFLYENIKFLRILINKASEKFHQDTTDEEIDLIMRNLREELNSLVTDLHKPSEKKQTKDLKLIFLGLDNSGKTSFLKSVEKRYSEMLRNLKPTKFIERSQNEIMGELGSSFHSWDFGGQSSYRSTYLKKAEQFFSDVDLFFFIVDCQDHVRLAESMAYINQIMKILDEFQEYPPLIILFHKLDKDLSDNKIILDRIDKFKEEFLSYHTEWKVNFFQTSIFDNKTILSAFSYGLTLISPNKEIFRTHLKWITQKMGGIASFLLNNNALILSDYSKKKEDTSNIEFSPGSFYNLFVKLEKFGLSDEKRNQLWETSASSVYMQKFMIENKEFYFLIHLKNNGIDFSIDKFTTHFKKFEEKITPLLKSYI